MRAQLGDVLAVEQHLARTATCSSPTAARSSVRLAGAVVAHAPRPPRPAARSTLDAVQHLGAAVAACDVDELAASELSSISSPGRRRRRGRGAQVDLLHLRVGLHLGHRPLASTLPACSTVTDAANGA